MGDDDDDATIRRKFSWIRREVGRYEISHVDGVIIARYFLGERKEGRMDGCGPAVLRLQ